MAKYFLSNRAKPNNCYIYGDSPLAIGVNPQILHNR